MSSTPGARIALSLALHRMHGNGDPRHLVYALNFRLLCTIDDCHGDFANGVVRYSWHADPAVRKKRILRGLAEGLYAGTNATGDEIEALADLLLDLL